MGIRRRELKEEAEHVGIKDKKKKRKEEAMENQRCP